jgi:hypothetical protein
LPIAVNDRTLLESTLVTVTLLSSVWRDIDGLMFGSAPASTGPLVAMTSWVLMAPLTPSADAWLLTLGDEASEITTSAVLESSGGLRKV